MSRNSHKHNKRNLDQPSKASAPATNEVHQSQTPGGYGAYVVKSTSTNGHGPVVSDASEGTAAKRRPQKQKTVLTSRRNSEYYVKEIIKRLEKIYSLTGARPSLIFDDWLSIAEATLTALPDQVKAVGVTGWFAEDPPEVKAIFEMVRARYQNSYNPEGATAVWECFGEAFSLLLESSEELSLWGIGSDEPGYSGPDILGAVYLKFASYDPSWAAQYFTPWAVALLAAKITIQNGEREIYDRLKKACLHPDNILGQAVVLASLVLPEEGGAASDWFFNHLIPAALPYYEPITFNEPAVGSGVMLLAAASQFPRWAVHRNLVVFTAQDIDKTCIAMVKISCMLHGLNGYGFRLYAATLEAIEAYQKRQNRLLAVPKPAGETVAEVITPGQVLDWSNPPHPPTPAPYTYESMFRRAAHSLERVVAQ